MISGSSYLRNLSCLISLFSISEKHSLVKLVFIERIHTRRCLRRLHFKERTFSALSFGPAIFSFTVLVRHLQWFYIINISKLFTRKLHLSVGHLRREQNVLAKYRSPGLSDRTFFLSSLYVTLQILTGNVLNYSWFSCYRTCGWKEQHIQSPHLCLEFSDGFRSFRLKA